MNIEVIMKISTFILEVEHKDDEDPVDVIFRFFVSIHYHMKCVIPVMLILLSADHDMGIAADAVC